MKDNKTKLRISLIINAFYVVILTVLSKNGCSECSKIRIELNIPRI